MLMGNQKVTQKSKARIGMIHYTLPPAISGVEMVIREHARLLDNRGYKVYLLGAKGSKIRKTIDIQIARSFDPKSQRVNLVQEELKKYIIPDDFKILKKNYKTILQKWIQKHQLKCIIVHNILSRHYNLALTAAIVEYANENHTDIKWITWVHDASFIDTYYTNLNDKLKKQYPWNLIAEHQKTFQYVCVSNTRKKEMIQVFGENKRMKVIHNGLDINKMLPLPLQTRELFKKVTARSPDYVGIIPVRIVERKNIEFAIEFAKIAEREFSKRFVFIITGAVHQQNRYATSYLMRLKDIIAKENLHINFIFLNEFVLESGQNFNIDKVNMRDLYLISDFLFLPSLGEGFGLPIIEAGFMRIPIFCSNLTVFKEVGNGFIYSFDLKDPIVNSVEYVLHQLKRRKSTLFRKKILKDFDFETIMDTQIIPFLE